MTFQIIGPLNNIEIAGNGIGFLLIKWCLRAVCCFVSKARGDFFE